MDEKDIKSVKLSKVVDGIHFPGYRRHAFYHDKEYGVEVGNVAFKVKFGIVMYRHPFGDTPRFELRIANIGSDGELKSLECIDSQILTKAVGETEYAKHIANIGGRPYFVGYPYGIPYYNAPLPFHICRSTVGRFLDHHGDELAVLLVSKQIGLGKVDTMGSAKEVLGLMLKVEAFMNEINTQPNTFLWESATATIKRLTRNRNFHLTTIGEYEGKLAKRAEEMQKFTEVIDQYGMTMENFKDIVGKKVW